MNLGRCLRVSLGIPGALALMPVSISAAADTDPATAESLFRAGKAYMSNRDYARACPAFADSFRADPATGTLLALALCFEGQGRIASAWKAYGEVAVRSSREGRADREKVARDKAALLESQLSLLTISLSPEAREIDGLQVKRNGNPLDPANFGKAIAVDGGSQLIDVSAPGRDRWRTTVVLAPKQDTKLVTIPALEESEPPVPTLARPPDPAPVAPPKPETPKPEPAPEPAKLAAVVAAPIPVPETVTRISAVQGAGIATFVAGVAGLGAGTFFGLRAISLNTNSKKNCFNNICGPQGTQDRWDAHDAGNLSTIAFVAGGVLVTGGAALYLFGKPVRAAASSEGPYIAAVPLAGSDGIGASLQGKF